MSSKNKGVVVLTVEKTEHKWATVIDKYRDLDENQFYLNGDKLYEVKLYQPGIRKNWVRFWVVAYNRLDVYMFVYDALGVEHEKVRVEVKYRGSVDKKR